jgi:diguanylate cyclase (GGDEF)-like protein/PAS domain S-box-containing protein
VSTLASNFALMIDKRKQAESDLRIAATAFESQEAMLVTDAKGVILRVNKAFTEDTGYTAAEAVGQTPRLFKSGRHDAEFYRVMWETINQTGTWQGEIWDRRKNGEIYPKWLTITAVKGNDGIVTHYVGIHVDITERKAAEKEIQLLAYYDPLTRLPNRRLLMDRLQHAMASGARTGREGGLLLIDLDNFKTLNDSLGHHIGDQLLQQIAQRLEACVRDGDTVARLGGDEFVVILENLSEHALEAAAQTESVGEKILASLSLPYQFSNYVHQSTCSIGATLFDDKHQSSNELLKQADIAMYQAKKAGRNMLRFFDPQMQASVTSRFSLEGELRKALENREFHLYYQIQMDILNRPVGAEVLIRWIHPLRGMISPAQFIPLAEDTGLIIPIGTWVLETACAQIKSWEQAAPTRDLVLAVNVSARQFHQADFVAQVQAVVQRHGINPARLKLELTESMLVEDVEQIIATMNSLNEIGIQFSMDDFGTGYSSLQYLKRLPLDQLKIDMSFVRDLGVVEGANSIVQTIIAMARGLKLDVIAEGVETEQQREILSFYGCLRYQGYLFGKPLPIDQFEETLKQD